MSATHPQLTVGDISVGDDLPMMAKNASRAQLFLYSSASFNPHRIHYDRDYAAGVEGYTGLVVHGPLLATLMVGLAVRSWPKREIAGFEFRGQRPVIDTDPFKVCASPRDDDRLDLWVADANGWLAMKGSADFRTDS